MSMRIIKLDDTQIKKKSQMSDLKQANNLNVKTSINREQQHSPTQTIGLYIKQIPRRPKSPFKKYEKAAIESSRYLSSSSSSLFPINQTSNIKKQASYNNLDDENNFNNTTANNNSNNCKTPAVLFTKRAPIDPNELKQANNLKLVNNFEDLVIACVDSSTISKENSLICYKKKYLLNLTGTNLDKTNELDNLPDKNLAKQHTVKLKNENKTIRDHVYLCAKCKSVLTDDEILENRNKLVHFKDEYDLNWIELENLKIEDSQLRKKVFDGDTNASTFRRLEQINDLFKKFTNRKNLLQKHRANPIFTTKEKSFSESDFTNELMLHPLIRKNTTF